MATTYDSIFDSFKDGITDPDLLEFTQDIQRDLLNALMNKAISKCKRICKDVDFNSKDDEIQEFTTDIPDEVIDIITEWMTVFWLKPYLDNIENLRNVLNTKDFSMYSPANLLDKINERYNSARKQARSLTNEYSYIHSDMTRLQS